MIPGLMGDSLRSEFRGRRYDVLVVGAEEGRRRAVTAALDGSGFRLGWLAIPDVLSDVVWYFRPACVVVDWDGTAALLDRLGPLFETEPAPVVIVLGREPRAGAATTCLRAGVHTYLTVPFRSEDLRASVESAMRRHREECAAAEFRLALRQELEAVTTALREVRTRQVERTMASLRTLVLALEAKLPMMVGHSDRVSSVCVALARTLGWSPTEVEAVRIGGALHDIGMVGIPQDFAFSKASLTPRQLEAVREHPIHGYRILMAHPALADAAMMVRAHHERCDGTGYPDGLGGDDIPWGGRVLAAAETFDALTTPRPHRVGTLPPLEAADQIAGLAGTALDPAVCHALVQWVKGGPAEGHHGVSTGTMRDLVLA